VTHVAAAPRAGVGTVRARRSIPVDVHDRLGEGLRGFLRQIVPDTARDDAVRIGARECLGIRTGVRVRRPVGIPFQRDGGHGDDRPLGQALFQGVVWRLACGQTQAPTVVTDHDADVIRVVEGLGGAIKRGRIEGPPQRGEPPDALGEVAPVLLVARPAALGGEIP
jgi:hypothetical protein